MKVYKAQWPVISNLKQNDQVCLIYEDNEQRSNPVFVPANEEIRKSLFLDGYLRVYFEGEVTSDGTVIIGRFVKQGDWVEG